VILTALKDLSLEAKDKANDLNLKDRTKDTDLKTKDKDLEKCPREYSRSRTDTLRHHIPSQPYHRTSTKNVSMSLSSLIAATT